jgi:hypothetical protein
MSLQIVQYFFENVGLAAVDDNKMVKKMNQVARKLR